MPDRNVLTSRVLDFMSVLRREHGFGVGHAHARDALRALEIVGVGSRDRARSALRSICCSSPDELEPFERAFAAFFEATSDGTPSPGWAPRHTRDAAAPQAAKERGTRRPSRDDATPADDAPPTPAAARVPTGLTSDDATAWIALRARYSPDASAAEPPIISSDGFDAMLGAASALLDAVRLGRSRKWRPNPRGARFDLRRTLRASLHTAGDPATLHRLGHPLRNPRFVVLIDGSGSMSEHAAPLLQLAAALVRRSRRSSAFAFSTGLRDVTAQLRRTSPGSALTDLGEAWGGGTRLGANLAAFVAAYGPRLLTDDTVALIASDGLDVGEGASLERAMREIHRRAAAVVWVNPHAGERGFEPTARGMRVAAPFVTLLASVRSVADVRELSRQLCR